MLFANKVLVETDLLLAKDKESRDMEVVFGLSEREGWSVHESKKQVKERWRHALETRGVKVCRNKAQYMRVNERETGVTAKMQRVESVKVDELKYLGLTTGQVRREVKTLPTVSVGSVSGWRQVSGVIGDRSIAARVKKKVYKMLVRPAIMYGLEMALMKLWNVTIFIWSELSGWRGRAQTDWTCAKVR